MNIREFPVRFAFMLLVATSFVASLPSSGWAAANLCETMFLPPTVAAPSVREMIGAKSADDKATNGDLGPAAPAFDRAAVRADLKALLLSIEKNYGPLMLKKSTIGLDWEAAKQKLLRSVSEINSMTDFHYRFANFLNSFNDAHISVSLPSTLTWKLPMQFSLAENKIVLNMFDPAKLPNLSRYPQLGDELISVNGKTLDQVQKTNPVFHKDGNDLTNRAFFARLLTSLNESSGIPLSLAKSKDVVFEMRGADGETYTIKATYESAGVGLIDANTSSANTVLKSKLIPGKMLQVHALNGANDNKSNDPSKPPGGTTLKDKDEVLGLKGEDVQRHEALIHKINQIKAIADLGFDSDPVLKRKKKIVPPSDTQIGQKIGLGERKPSFKLPADFKEIKVPVAYSKIFNSDDFFAGVFMRNGKRVGFLRIPSYELEDMDMMLPSVRLYISVLEAMSDYLVIDQTNNPGGAVQYSDFIVKSLVGKYVNSKHARFLMKPTPNAVRQFAELIEEIRTEPSFLPDAQKQEFIRKAKTEFDKLNTAYVNNQNLSEPVSLRVLSEYVEAESQAMLEHSDLATKTDVIGIDLLKPAVYTKKVYFLINELDFSGGDLTPGVLQDYGRVKLVGIRTAGAGGTVEEFGDRIASDIDFRLTTSLMLRKNNVLVENYGVTADIPFNLLVQDYKDGFKTTLERILQTIENSEKNQLN